MNKALSHTGLVAFLVLFTMPLFAASVPEEEGGGALSAGTPVEGEPFVDHIFATPAEYTELTGKRITSYGESPMLAALVSEGKLPPVAERLPKEPLVVRPIEDIGQYGGTFRDYVRTGGGTSELSDYIRRRMLLWPPDGSRFYPNIIKGWDQPADGSSLTLFLRHGMKWSDGEDFDADDFLFWWEDIQQNEEITPELRPLFRPGGEPMKIAVIDPYAVRFEFAVPVPNAEESWFQSRPWAPRHYLEQYHLKYNADADALAKSEGFDSWWQAFRFHGVWTTRHKYYFRDAEAPVIHPWKLAQMGAEAFVWDRNPYYHMIDTAGNQLPYVDEIRQPVLENVSEILPLKIMNGEIDFAREPLSFGDFPIYKQNEAEGSYTTYLFDNETTSFAFGFALNYTHKDPVLRAIFNDLRFRQALSLAINREDISETLFLGQTRPFTAPVRPEWPGYEDWMGSYFADHDVDEANRLLDEMGLAWDADGKWRRRPDGEVLQIIAEYHHSYSYGESLLDLVRGHWARIGVRLEPKTIDGKLWLERALANELDVGMWSSDGGAVISARGTYPRRLIPPYHLAECCPMAALPWRQWLDSEGAEGIEPPDDVKRAYAVAMEWRSEPIDSARYEQLANEMIKLTVENLRFFGTVSAPPLVAMINNRIGNMRGGEGWVNGLRRLHPYLTETWYIKQ